MKKRYTLIICWLLGANVVNAQSHAKLQHRLHAGFNFGALAPVNLPNTIRKIEGWWPGFSPSLGYQLIYPLNHKWGLATGLGLDWKGMRVKDSVQYMHTLITVHDGTQTGSFEGDFSGKNETKVRNAYVTLPVKVTYQPGKYWQYSLGLYAAQLIDRGFSGDVSNGYIRNGNSLGEKVEISRATFDFSNEQRSFDWGIVAGAERKINHRLAVDASLQWGLRPVFAPSFRGVDFKMYNIFVTLGAVYRIF